MKLARQYIFLLLVLTACNNSQVDIPKERYYQFNTETKMYFENDTICFFLNNPVKSPLRYYISSSDENVDKLLHDFKPITLYQLKDTILKISADSSDIEKITIRNVLGDLNQKILKNKISLPFPKGKSYKIIQGYNGSYSHNIDDISRHAIDFDLQPNDTVCSADDGLVVGVIKDYKVGGPDKRLRNKGNFITIFHPRSGLFTQYGHLAYQGSLVVLGDSVAKGQPIGLSGNTGWSDGPHLHFNVLVPVAPINVGSVKIEFEEGYAGEDLKRNDLVTKSH